MLKDIFLNNEQRDLTKGSITRNIRLLAVPMVISNILHTLLNIIDIFWVGRLGSTAIAAVAMSGVILMVIMTVVMGLVTGTKAMVARFVGAKDEQLADEVARQSLLLGIIMAVVMAAVGIPASDGLLRLLGASPEVVDMGGGYMRIMLAGNLFMLFTFLISGILHGVGDAVSPMVIMTVAVGINIVADPIFIFGIGVPRMGVEGAALATILAQAIACILGVRVLLTGRSHIHIRLKKIKPNFGLIWRMVKIGMPSSLQMGFRSIMGVVVMGIVAGFGTYAVAAYGIGMRLQMTVLMAAFALGDTASTLVGQNLGAARAERASRSAWAATGIGMIIMGGVGLVFFIFAPGIIRIFNSQAEVVQIGDNFLKITSVFYIFMAMGIVLGRALNGAGDTISPMFITLVCLWGVQIPLALFLSRQTPMGLTGVWWAIVLANFLQGFITAVWFSMGRWKHKQV